MSRRVVVTGIGVITPIGIGKKKFWQGLTQEKSGGQRMDQVEDHQQFYPLDLEDIKTKVGAPILDFDPLDFIGKKKAKRTGKSIQFALAATKLALEDAGLKMKGNQSQGFEIKEVNSDRTGVVIGTCLGDLNTIEKNHTNYLNRGPRGISLFFAPKFMNNGPAAQVSIQYRITGTSYIIGSACASGTHAIGNAWKELAWDRTKDLMIAGGVGAILTRFMLATFSQLRVTTTRNDKPQKASRPFDKKRDGFLPGEGAGILILETLDQARARGAEIYAELLGFGDSSDAEHITDPDPKGKGAKKAMGQALQRAGISLDEVDYINAHGTATPKNDLMETKAIKRLFGNRAYRIPVSSNKSQIGHLVAGAGAVEAAATILALNHNLVPATINYENPDPECDLDYVPKPREKRIEIALSNSFGFGGHNGTLCLAKFE